MCTSVNDLHSQAFLGSCEVKVKRNPRDCLSDRIADIMIVHSFDPVPVDGAVLVMHIRLAVLAAETFSMATPM